MYNTKFEMKCHKNEFLCIRNINCISFMQYTVEHLHLIGCIVQYVHRLDGCMRFVLHIRVGREIRASGRGQVIPLTVKRDM